MEHQTCKILPIPGLSSGMIKATSDAWLKGWDERNGGNLTLRLDEADIAPFAATSTKPRYIAKSTHAAAG